MAPNLSASPRSPKLSSTNPLAEELRVLFDRGEHESVVLRAEHLSKRKRSDNPNTRILLDTARASSLIHLGRSIEALPVLTALSDNPDADRFKHVIDFSKRYVSWATGEGLATAADGLNDSDDHRKLRAQLAYRGGEFAEAARIYEGMLTAVRNEMEERRKPASRWTLTARKETPVLTASELMTYRETMNELATNCTAALVLAGEGARVKEVVKGLANSYELQYNSACASIAAEEFEAAEEMLEKAEALIRAEIDEEEEDVEETLAPIRVQKAYLAHVKGEVKGAEMVYRGVMADRKADAASLAVAANNLTVALGQLAFGKGDAVEGGGLPKGEHEALVEGLKKMRTTAGKNVERKLAVNQRRAMARNRAILLVQMGRYDACRAELNKLKAEFPKDPLVPLIEASLVAKQGHVETADKILRAAGDGEVVRAGRVQLMVASGEKQKAAKLLEELFPKRAGATVTGARLLEESGDVDGALDVLQGLVEMEGVNGDGEAKKAFAECLLRNGKYKQAAETFREVCKKRRDDVVAQAQLVVATSYFDAEEAELAALLLPVGTTDADEVNGAQLEKLPPPKRKDILTRQRGEMDAEMKMEKGQNEGLTKEKKKKKKKKRLPKNYDPNGPPPDPERWLPKTLRTGYKKKKKTDGNAFRGSQGADAAAADMAAAKNAERASARAAERDSGGAGGGRGQRQRRKRNRR